jgi:hypothetical protein
LMRGAAKALQNVQKREIEVIQFEHENILH